MDQVALDKYLHSMEFGEWGDGVMLSAAVRLYGRPIVVITPDGAEQMVDAARESPAERVRLGLINNNHYVSINTVYHDENSDSFVAEPEQTLSDGDTDKCGILSELLESKNAEQPETLVTEKNYR